MSIGMLINIDLGSVYVYRCVNQHRLCCRIPYDLIQHLIQINFT